MVERDRNGLFKLAKDLSVATRSPQRIWLAQVQLILSLAAVRGSILLPKGQSLCSLTNGQEQTGSRNEPKNY